MPERHTAAFGVFPSRARAEECINNLLNQKFKNEDISVLLSDPELAKEMGVEKGSKAPEGATTGATTGGVIGGALGMLAGIGALAIPGLGPFIAAGPIMGTLAGLGAGAATGGVIGALMGMGVPEYEAKAYEERLKKGEVFVSARCESPDRMNIAKEILQRCGGEGVCSSGECARH
jgi:hypothetical protein